MWFRINHEEDTRASLVPLSSLYLGVVSNPLRGKKATNKVLYVKQQLDDTDHSHISNDRDRLRLRPLLIPFQRTQNHDGEVPTIKSLTGEVKKA